MPKTKSIFYNALLLTAVHLLLRFAGTSFHIFLSRRVGASGLGLLQLVMSVGNLALVAGMAGIRTTAMYLTAGELGKNRPENAASVLSGCFCYSILCSGFVGALLYLAAPLAAARWIGNPDTVPAIRLFAAFMPIVCLCGVMSGYFTAANKIPTLAAVEVVEQLCSMGITLALLTLWAGNQPEKACMSVILGSSLGACITLALLLILRCAERAPRSKAIPVRTRILQTAFPLAAADLVRSGIGTAENLMVPKRLRLCPGEHDPLSAFGRISGIVFPVMMFPACILFALAELLIPELARCAAAGCEKRIRRLVQKGLWSAMIYGIFFGGLVYLFAEPICAKIYHSPAAGVSLRSYALMIPFLYCDAITDAMTKGLGQQKICVRYNILTSALDVLLLFLLLPGYGMGGYFFSFLVTHVLNFWLSLRRLCRITHLAIPLCRPILAAACGVCAVLVSAHGKVLYVPILFFLMHLCGIIRREDLRWLTRRTIPG